MMTFIVTMRRLKSLISWMGIVLLITACNTTPTPNPDAQIRAAVAATLASFPTPTSFPLPSPFPTPTPPSIKGVFCEYDFCIGHPPNIYLIDQGSTRQPPFPSNYAYGILFSYSQDLFIEIAWTTKGPNFDPQKTMQLILEEKESLQGSLDAQLVTGTNVYSQAITTVTPSLPFGGIAAWQCGDRDFVWKIYTSQDGLFPGLLRQALAQFKCANQ